MLREDMDEWAELHGYMRYRCPSCKRTFWSDSGPEGNCPCGYTSEEEESEEE